ncbi:MAG: hypothetical protein ACKUBY_02645 [Candidatus Moraniibacteriota bacterium]|jgi:hypothetical protein
MNEHEKSMEGLVIRDDTETRLEGSKAKIKILQNHMADQDEQLRQFVVAVRHIRVVLGSLPKDWHAKVSVGFSPVKQVEEIEDILSELKADSSDWIPPNED